LLVKSWAIERKGVSIRFLPSRSAMHRIGIHVAILALLAAPAAMAAKPAPRHETERGASSGKGARRKVLLIVSPAQQDSLALLRAELEALGLEVSEVKDVGKASLGEEPFDPSSLPKSSNAPEEFRIVLRPTHVEVWVFDRATRKVTLREIFAESDGAPLDTRTAVLHTVELLRWQLHEGQPKTQREPVVGSRSAAPAAIANQEQQRTWLFSLVPQAVYSPGGTSLGAGAELDAAWRWSRFAARLLVSSALLPNELTSIEGTAQIVSRTIGLEGVLLSSKQPLFSGFEVGLGLGVALVGTELRARAASGYQAQDDQLLTAAPLLDLRASYALSRFVAIAACSSILTPARANSLRFGDREAGRYGQLIVNVGVGAQITIF
jgi:hypothetical protein